MNKQLLKEIVDSGQKHYLYFFADYCDACKVLKPKLKGVVDQKILHEINGEEDPELMRFFKVQYYPSVVKVESGNWMLWQGSDVIENHLIN